MSTLAFVRRSTSVRSSSVLGTVQLGCWGGARSGNPDADITIWVEIWLEGSGVVASAQSTGYMPSAHATTEVETVDYDRRVECYVIAGGPYAQAGGTLNADCGDERTVMRQEYRAEQVAWTPACTNFASSGGSAHFDWDELNGQFSDGNPHRPWGIINQALTDGLEATRANYNRGGIRLTGGYRCPHGNKDVGGTKQSFHMHGRAADMKSDDHEWTEVEFNLLRAAANLTGPIESLFWNSYSDHHFHAAW